MMKKKNLFKNAYWRYQVINAGTKKNTILNVHELWINRKTGKFIAYTENPKDINGWDNSKDLEETLKLMLKSCKKYPVMTTKEINKHVKSK